MSYTRIPDNIIDNMKLDPYQFQLLSIIIRKTDGWCKVEDGISLSQFEKMVTFKKPKIISTLKQLVNMGLIELKKQLNNNGGNSYNMYKIGHTLVTENNYPSNVGLQGVVTEDYTQKKAITKETKTINTDATLISEFKSETNAGEVAIEVAKWFITYRKKIKHPIKTIAPLKAIIKSMRDCINAGYKIEELKELIETKEWQSLKLEWVQKETVKVKEWSE